MIFDDFTPRKVSKKRRVADNSRCQKKILKNEMCKKMFSEGHKSIRKYIEVKQTQLAIIEKKSVILMIFVLESWFLQENPYAGRKNMKNTLKLINFHEVKNTICGSEFFIFFITSLKQS